jgi:hypothetical protein
MRASAEAASNVFSMAMAAPLYRDRVSSTGCGREGKALRVRGGNIAKGEYLSPKGLATYLFEAPFRQRLSCILSRRDPAAECARGVQEQKALGETGVETWDRAF